ncbi:MAG TPA: hypothetical protein VNM46_03695 [Xanthobacteraceae bacterium]|jgi:hypothetical protein|nr:hypothetical protein [Xanthobacteraceae bacterium]
MCDYSLMHVQSRAAQVGDKLVSTGFQNTISRGFAAAGDLNTAVCLLPGTEIAFDHEVEHENHLGSAIVRHPATVARFRQIDTVNPYVHHDALEFPDGTIVLLTRLLQGQHATVLQLPAVPQTAEEQAEQKRVEIVA